MASFNYAQSTMASSADDFTLFPAYDWQQDQSFMPTTTYQDQAYLEATTFDSSFSQPAFSNPQLEQYQFGVYPQKLGHPLSPRQSPAQSATNSFDCNNPNFLSSVSDSGASAHSTISSAMASPSVLPQINNEWSQQMQQGVKFYPGIVQHDETFVTAGLDYETIPVGDTKGCVGELNNISSCQQQDIPLSLPNMMPPVPLTRLSAVMPVLDSKAGSSSPHDSVFRSPNTPASATHSPLLSRAVDRRQRSAVRSQPRQAVPSSFFSQSSGSFLPPLDFSCLSLVSTSPLFVKETRTFTDKPLDPSLIQPFSPYQDVNSPHQTVYAPIPSPAPSGKSMRSPHLSRQHWQPYPAHSGSRRQSISSVHSRHSQVSTSSDDSNKGLCPIQSCGRHFKDLKAHMLTHQETRPEKCPIPTCDYHIKGFARKYDKNRHTLTHYKGTMVCGFCPGSGSSAEKSFNRADVFKRHLTSVHQVEQTPPNARRKSPVGHSKRATFGMRDASGMCSTCSNVFANPQDFYEHLDDCVLRVVQQADPREAVNQKLLSSMTDDPDVQNTLERHSLSNDLNGPTSFDDDEDEDEYDDDSVRDRKPKRKNGS